MKHPINIEKYAGTLEELAEDIGNLRYDRLEIFFKLLSAKFIKDSGADQLKGRHQLSAILWRLWARMDKASRDAYVARKISKPYMGSEDGE